MRPGAHPHAEVDELRRRLAALESELARCQRLAIELRESDERLRILSESAIETVAVLDRGVIVEVNDRVQSMFGYAVADTIGRPAIEFAAPESRELVAHNIRSGHELPYRATGLRRDGSTFVGEFRGRGVIYQGRPARVTMILDVTAARGSDVDGADALPAALRASFTAPVLPIADGVVLLPLLGALAPERVESTLGALLAGVAQHRARAVILDVTGATPRDAAVADLIVRAVRATRLLGARTIVTGARAVDLGIELGVDVRGTLGDGVRDALAQT